MLRVVFQVVFLAVVGGLLWYLFNNLVTNLARIGQAISWGWLRQPAGFAIRDSVFSPAQAVRDAIEVGVGNTAQIAFIGIALAAIIGIVVGVARLSTNWLVRKAAALYVETLRNIPVLLIIIFMYTAVILRLPAIQEASEWLGLVVLSNRAVVVPWADAGPTVGTFLVLAGIGLAVAIVVAVWRTRRFAATGAPHHRVLWGAAVFGIIALASYFALREPLVLSVPVRDGRVISGGIGLGPEYAALLIGLVIYTASHIAEIVRGSILAVPKGQTEAAQAIALTTFQRLRFVILPQAFRIMVPPLANQFLNLTKNSSLAVFIGYPEITQIIATVIGNGNPAPPAIAILMLVYLAFSLGISIVANLFNRALAIEGRT